ncbi:MAG: two-component regulator propeller domain-containing protein, partial [Thermoguttaceae bacterium]
ADKVRGLYGGAPKDWKECPKEILEQLLPEDYVTCIAEDAAGTIWMGTRLKGFMAIDPQTGRRGTGDRGTMGMADNYVSAILPMPDGMPLIGLYIGGVIKPNKELKLQTKNNANRERKINTLAKSGFAALPSPIKPPTIDDLKAMQSKLEKLTKPLPKIYAAYSGEDWKTQGDWIGRTFRDWAVLCAVVAPFDHPVYFTTEFYSVHEFIGPNYREKDDAIRRWIHWIKTDNPKTLYDPWYGYRRQAEWDDHGEVYPMSMDGPDLWYLLRIRHPGTFRIGMYFFNKDGHSGMNRVRDYMLEMYSAPPAGKMVDWPQYKFTDWPRYSKIAEGQVSKTHPLAKSRMRDFWGGVHKQFIVTGPAYYFVKIDRNYSFNTILSSISVDRLIGEPTWHEKLGVPMLCEKTYEPPPFPASYSSGEGRQIGLLWKTLDEKFGFENGINIQQSGRVATYKAAISLGVEDEEIDKLAKSLKWRLNQWDVNQRREWRDAMRYAHEEFLKRCPSQRKAIEQYENRKK